MSNMIPFESSLPAYLAKTNAAGLNADLLAHAPTGFPVISIQGKAFSVVRNGDRTMLANQKDPDSPATHIDMVVLKVNKNKSKVFYLAGYDAKGESKKPDCFSNDGAKPDPSAEKPQAKLCMLCPHNQWNSASGGGKGKACQDSVRIAVATVNQLNDPYLIRVPPASIRALGEFGNALAKRGVPYNAVITRISFDPEFPTPKLMFKPIGFLKAEEYVQAEGVSAGEVVRAIIGSHDVVESEEPALEAPAVAQPAVETKSESKTHTVEEVEAAIAKAKVSAAPKASTKPAAKPQEVEVEVDDLDLDDVNFDD